MSNYTCDWAGFKRYTEDEFTNAYRKDSDAATLVHEIVYGLGATLRLSTEGWLKGRADRMGANASQEKITATFRGAWLYLFRLKYGYPYENPNGAREKQEFAGDY